MLFSGTVNVLIVGGTGFIGSHLAERCLSWGCEVACLGIKSGKEIKGAETITADISDRSSLRSVLSGRRFDYVFNLGGYIDHTPYFKGGRRLIEAHFSGLMNLIENLDLGALKGFVQIGSSDEYGGAPAPQSEFCRESPIAPYSVGKTAATHLVQTLSRSEGFPGVALRFFLVYGPGQDENRFLPQVIKGCLDNVEFRASEGLQLRDFCYVEDVVDAMITAAIRPQAKGQVINIASGKAVTIREVIERIATLTGGGKPLWGAHAYREGENMALYADVSLAKKLLDWEASTGLEEGLAKTIEFYKRRINPEVS